MENYHRQLIAGLTLDSSGLIAGTPSTVGKNSFTVEVKDFKDSLARKVFTLRVDAPIIGFKGAGKE